MTKAPNEFSAQDLELQSTDLDNYPYMKLRGNLIWNGSSWEKWDGGISIDASDIEIGAVELKDGESDTRVAIGTDGTQNALWTQNKSLDSVIYPDGGVDDITTGIAIMGRRQDMNEPQPIAVDYRGYVYTLNNSEYNENQEDISATGLAIMHRDTSSLFQPVAEDTPLPSRIMNSLVPETYDYIALTYVATGDGEGEVETVTYKTGGSGGTTQATLTLGYNGDNKLSSVTKA